MTVEEAPKRADGEAVPVGGQLMLKLHQGDVACLLHQLQDQVGLRLDPGGEGVSAARLGRDASCVPHPGAPAHGAGDTHPEALGRLPPRHPAIDGGNHPLPKVQR